ncbi:unnamed protein product [Prorocentrum cordatum]|uniref:WW domain-containing protein n=1 Tax=Prorocentrum cordatum TaxID=2364126 RepID=A0ABN9TFX2_9DINO|nr:unnamed protein product [Polarella glacialis]
MAPRQMYAPRRGCARSFEEFRRTVATALVPRRDGAARHEELRKRRPAACKRNTIEVADGGPLGYDSFEDDFEDGYDGHQNTYSDHQRFDRLQGGYTPGEERRDRLRVVSPPSDVRSDDGAAPGTWDNDSYETEVNSDDVNESHDDPPEERQLRHQRRPLTARRTPRSTRTVSWLGICVEEGKGAYLQVVSSQGRAEEANEGETEKADDEEDYKEGGLKEKDDALSIAALAREAFPARRPEQTAEARREKDPEHKQHNEPEEDPEHEQQDERGTGPEREQQDEHGDPEYEKYSEHEQQDEKKNPGREKRPEYEQQDECEKDREREKDPECEKDPAYEQQHDRKKDPEGPEHDQQDEFGEPEHDEDPEHEQQDVRQDPGREKDPKFEQQDEREKDPDCERNTDCEKDPEYEQLGPPHLPDEWASAMDKTGERHCCQRVTKHKQWSPPPPDSATSYLDKQGRRHYHNEVINKTQWTPPLRSCLKKPPRQAEDAELARTLREKGHYAESAQLPPVLTMGPRSPSEWKQLELDSAGLRAALTLALCAASSGLAVLLFLNPSAPQANLPCMWKVPEVRFLCSLQDTSPTVTSRCEPMGDRQCLCMNAMPIMAPTDSSQIEVYAAAVITQASEGEVALREAEIEQLHQVLETLTGDAEIANRVCGLLPALSALVAGRQPSWLDRLRRNVALHAKIVTDQLSMETQGEYPVAPAAGSWCGNPFSDREPIAEVLFDSSDGTAGPQPGRLVLATGPSLKDSRGGGPGKGLDNVGDEKILMQAADYRETAYMHTIGVEAQENTSPELGKGLAILTIFLNSLQLRLVPIRALGSQGGWRVCQTAGIVACFWMFTAVFAYETKEFGLVSVEPEEQGKARGKKAACEGRFVTLLGLQQSKRELIWLLESKVGQRHDPHFAADSANAARNQGSKQGVARRRELEEFASLRQEALGTQRPSAAEGLFGEPASAVGLKRKAAPDAGGAAAAAKRPSAAKAPAEAAAEEAQPAAQPEATPPAPPGDAAEAASEEEGALGGLAAYDSDEDEEDDEDEKLPPPAL